MRWLLLMVYPGDFDASERLESWYFETLDEAKAAIASWRDDSLLSYTISEVVVSEQIKE